jgi:hypothetical protein
MTRDKTKSQAAGEDAAANRRRIEAVLEAAERQGLLGDRTARVSVRVSPALLKQAKKLTRIETDNELIVFALPTLRWKRMTSLRCSRHGEVPSQGISSSISE